MTRIIPPEARPEPGTVHYKGSEGGWGSMRGMALVESNALAAPGAAETLYRQNKPGGFMCVSCAWGKPPNPHPAEFCENGAKATIWDLTVKRCTPEFFAQHTVSELRGWSDFDLENVGRLTHPLRYDAALDKYVEASWEEAFAAIGAKLRALNPKQTTFYASGKASLEASYLYALFARIYGHNNLPDSSNMCHETTSVGLKKLLGSPVGTSVYQDLDVCDMILHIGQNPGTNSPRILHPLKDAAERGCKIVAVNPLKEKGLIEFIDPQNPWHLMTGQVTPIATQFVQVHPGGDIALLTGIAKYVLEKDKRAPVVDWAFVEAHTHGFEEWRTFVENADWLELERVSGATRAQMEQAGETYSTAKAVLALYGMGITQHVQGWQSLGALVNLMLLRGNVGKPGAGVQSIRGHSNVQGQRTVGITEKPELAPLDKYRELFGFEPPWQEGCNVVRFLEALLKGEMKGFVALGGNLARAVPDYDRIKQVWPQMELTVNIVTRLNVTTLLPGQSAWILPCLARAEEDVQAGGPQQVSMEDTFSHVYGSIGKRTPASPHLKSETAIVCGLAKATSPEHPLQRWDEWTGDYRKIRALIAKTFPDQFHDMEARMNQAGGFYRGNAAHERIWKTPSGKAEFTTPTTLDATELEAKPGRYKLITVRSNDQFNTTVYGYSDRLRGIEGERDILMMSPRDIAEAGLKDGQRVALVTDLDDGVTRRVEGLKLIPYDIPLGTVGGYMPELNTLVPLSRHDALSMTPANKGTPVRVIPAAQA
jgi:molybdopterin-dependent oxidoreductase alpha subunit